MKQEVREPAIYTAVITAIASGCSKMNEIGEDTSRKTIYSIENPMLRFWYRFVPENISIISRGAAIYFITEKSIFISLQKPASQRGVWTGRRRWEM